MSTERRLVRLENREQNDPHALRRMCDYLGPKVDIDSGWLHAVAVQIMDEDPAESDREYAELAARYPEIVAESDRLLREMR